MPFRSRIIGDMRRCCVTALSNFPRRTCAQCQRFFSQLVHELGSHPGLSLKIEKGARMQDMASSGSRLATS